MRKSEKDKLKEIQEYFEGNLFEYAKYMFPDRYYGDLHEDIFNFIQYGESNSKLVLVPRDHQKVLRRDEPVLLSNGEWKKTGELTVGDKLADPVTGGEQEVTYLHPWGEDDYYEFTLDDGRTIKSGAGHLWEIEQHGFKEGPIVRDTLWIKDHYKKQRLEKRTGNWFTEHKTAIKAPSPLQFEEVDLPIDPYTLGVWIGDGTSTQGAVTTEDLGIVENLSSKGYKVTKRASKYGYGVIGLEKELRELGVLGNKRIPENYLKGSIDQRMELLRGLLDTDGNINKTNGIVSFSQCEKRKEIVDSVVSLVRSLGGKAKISEALTKVSKESTEYFKSYTVNIWLPKKVGNPFKLERKAGIYDKVARFKPQMLKTWITDVKPVGRHSSRCITVSNPRGLYIANNYIVTHNSHCIAVAASWFITCDPATSINYVSYNSDLVQKQLAVIKGILRSERHRQVWPDMLNWVNERGDIKHKPKGIWQQDKFEVDHPKRGTGVADPTVRAGTVRGTNTGMHCKITIFDDLVTDENYESASDRMDVKRCYESFSKIASTGSKTYAVGTRHDDNDLYKELMEEEAIYYDDDGNEIREKLWEVFERKVEDSVNHTGDGNFIWPRMQMPDGEWYGFDRRELAIKKAKSSNLAFFGAQYYNDPNIFEGAGRLSRKHFKYYDSRHLSQINGKWCIANTPLKIYAAGDLAFTDSSSRNAKKRDFTALAVIGVDHEGNTYILALERFQTDKPEVYFEKIVQLQEYWGFRKIVLESNNAGKIIKNQIEALVRKEGRYLEVEGRAHTSHDGKKEERIEHALVGRYRNGSIYHPKHGMTKMLEEELLASRPPHDDLMDAVSLAVSISKPPVHSGDNIINFKNRPRPQKASRFGGVRGRRGF